MHHWRANGDCTIPSVRPTTRRTVSPAWEALAARSSGHADVVFGVGPLVGSRARHPDAAALVARDRKRLLPGVLRLRGLIDRVVCDERGDVGAVAARFRHAPHLSGLSD